MTPVEIAVEVVGWGGALLILFAYLLLSMEKLTGQSPVYQWMNVFGAAALRLTAGGTVRCRRRRSTWCG